MLIKAGKEVAKSVVVAKAAEAGARRLGLTALASGAGAAVWGSSLGVARWLYPQYLDPVSSNQINRDPEYVMNCHILLPTCDVVSKEKTYEVFDFYCQKFARFRERVVVRPYLWPYWEPVEKVDLSQHIFFDSTEMDHDTLQELISKSLTQGLNPLLPLWRFIVFTNYTFQDGTRGSMMFFKYHHCMGDGFTLARTLFTGAEGYDELGPDVSKPKSSVKAAGGQGGGFEASKTLSAAGKLVALQDDPPSALKAKSLLKPLDHRVACWGTSKITITEIKKAAKSGGFTINDMVLAALSASLRQYQMQKGEAVVDPLAAVWVALRPLAEAFQKQDADKVYEPGNTTLGAVYLRLPVAKEFESRADRVKAICEEISNLKGSPEPLLAQGTMGLFGLLPKTLSNPIWHALSNKVSISVSNVPGPSVDFKWCGARPTGLSVFVPPVGTISTFCLITSFNDHITLSLAMDGFLFSNQDAQFIEKTFQEELMLLTTSMLQEGSSRL
jgi:hypothetical protein